MRVILYSSLFLPSIGGIEIVTDTLATNLVELGHECVVVTETLCEKDPPRNYEVVRKPSFRDRLKITRECSIVHANGASVAMYPFARLTNKPFVWTHNGYQVSCVDGLGWVDGEPAPMTPIASLTYHLKKKGLAHFLKESIKLAVRRYVAEEVDLNIAGSQWVAKRQPLPRQFIGYNPYPLAQMKLARNIKEKKYNFIYVGRLVSEKGVEDLIRAFHLLVSELPYRNQTLAIVGGGVMKSVLEELVCQLNLTDNVFFLGPKRGMALVETIGQAEIGIVPSVWEEPYGGVTLELLAAGKNIIVSEYGGHAECAGNAGLKFKNGDFHSLYECMVKIITDRDLAKRYRENAWVQVEAFDDLRLTKKYIELYNIAAKKKIKLTQIFSEI